MFSFPRDTAQFPLYDAAGGTFSGKLNQFAGWTKGATNPDGTSRFPNPGQQSLAYEIGYLLGIPIDYYASINICGFPQLIDAVGRGDVCNTMRSTRAIPRRRPAVPPRSGPVPHGRRHGAGLCTLAPRQQRLRARETPAAAADRHPPGHPPAAEHCPPARHRHGACRAWSTPNFPPDQIDQLVALANQVHVDIPQAEYVFQFPEWATHLPGLRPTAARSSSWTWTRSGRFRS